jgi:lipid II:glycine glycyltransferase (peptidoglycan interpeptide bridge formation enzyme)
LNMPVLEIRPLDNIDPSSALGTKWETLVRANPASGFMQSLNWAEVKRRQGLTAFHLGVFQDGELMGGAIFYASMRRNGAGILIAPEGPVLPWEHEALATQALRLIMDTAQSQASQLGVMAMRIEPRLPPPPMPALREFGRAPADLVPRETLYIDLSLTEQSLLQGMRPKGRYNIALSLRHGVQVLEDSTGAAIEEFHSIVKEASKRDDFALEPQSFFEHLAAVMCPAGSARFLFSKHEGETLGALLLMTYGNRATYLYGGISNKKRNFMSGYALQWTAMTMAKELGCATYDFYGIDSFRAPEHRYGRFSQFKSQFGGQVMRFIGAQDYFFLDNLADAFIKVVAETKDQVQEKAEAPPAGAKLATLEQGCRI